MLLLSLDIFRVHIISQLKRDRNLFFIERDYFLKI